MHVKHPAFLIHGGIHQPDILIMPLAHHRGRGFEEIPLAVEHQQFVVCFVYHEYTVFGKQNTVGKLNEGFGHAVRQGDYFITFQERRIY